MEWMMQGLAVLWCSVGLALPVARPIARPVAQASDVDGEFWIRAAARQMAQRARSGERDVVAGLAPWPGDASSWLRELAELEALERAGLVLEPERARSIATDRPELSAARLRVLPSNVPGFPDQLRSGLRSPFAALRAAAVDRLARWTLEACLPRETAHRFIVAELERGDLAFGIDRQLFGLALRCGGVRRLDALLMLPIAREELARNDRADWDAGLGFMEEILATPLEPEELDLARAAGIDTGVVDCLVLVGRVRDGLALDPPSTGAMARVLREGARAVPGDEPLDTYDLDEAFEAFVDALVIEARHLGDDAVVELGETLVRTADESPGRDRCIRVAARLLPMARQLELGLAYDEADALELLYGLERAERWHGGPELVEALGAWVVHPSVEVRESVVRAVGQRYAYGGRADFEPLLVRVLRDSDPTLRSLSFAWLVKSDRRARPEDDLGPVLRSAWDAEGHGGEGPALTERQARWLAQFPRERTARHYRDALLGLLSLSGASSEALGEGSLELLGGFRGDAEIFARVSLLVERSLEGLLAAGDFLGALPFDSAAARGLRILQRVDPSAAEPLIDGALRRSMDIMHGPGVPEDARPQLPKTAAALLARTGDGRERLSRYLGDDVPRRVRFEAALQLLMRGRPGEGDERLDPSVFVACAQRLMADYGGVDGALRMRALKALGQPSIHGDATVEPFLIQLTGAGVDQSERTAAIESLGRRRQLNALDQVMASATDAAGPDAATIDAAAHAARALRHSSRSPEAVAAFELGARKLRELDARNVAGSSLETLRGALLEALAEILLFQGTVGEAVPGASWEARAEVLGRVLYQPIRFERATARKGFGRQRRIEASFLWASELAALKVLGRDHGLFREAVGDASRWGHLDGRLLLALARVAAEAAVGDLAAQLSHAAAIALQGEGTAMDHERRLAEARWLHANSLEGGTPASAAAAARSLRAILVSLRTGALGRGVLRAMLPGIRRPVATAHARYWARWAEGGEGPWLEASARAWSRLR